MVRKSLCLGLVVVSALVFACGSSSNRDGFEDASGNGKTAGSGNRDGNGTENTSLGTEPPPAPPAQPEECQKMDIIFVVDDGQVV